jgi:hypothetical protein
LWIGANLNSEPKFQVGDLVFLSEGKNLGWEESFIALCRITFVYGKVSLLSFEKGYTPFVYDVKKNSAKFPVVEERLTLVKRANT